MPDYGGYTDPFASTSPDVGQATAFGTGTEPGSNQPLIDWASKLQKDDLARFLHDPAGTASDLAARGVEPPNDAAIQQIHDHNERVGTPSRSTRFNVGPTDPFAAPIPDPSQGNITRPMAYSGEGELKPTGPLAPVGEAIQKGQLTPGNVKGAIQDRFAPFQKKEAPPPAPAPAPPAVKPEVAPIPVSTAKHKPKQEPAGAALEPVEEPAPEPAPKKEEVTAGLKTPEERQKLGEEISKIGKAMQGVKAPEPLRPPQIGAPTVKGHTAMSAPPLAQLLGLASGIQTGQVPASAMPVLHLLGRI